jgi:hypothetical protein
MKEIGFGSRVNNDGLLQNECVMKLIRDMRKRKTVGR